MPNHVTHRIRIFGTPDDRRAFFAAHLRREDEKEHFDFETLIPMPPRLHGETSFVGEDAALYLLLASFGTPDIVGSFGRPCRQPLAHWNREVLDQLKADLERLGHGAWREEGAAWLRNVADYGFGSWYEWSIEHWGTKWNAYEFRRVDETEARSEVMFDTAWSPPLPIFEKMAERWPSLRFQIFSYDEGGNFACKGWFNGEEPYTTVPADDELYELTYGEPRTVEEE